MQDVIDFNLLKEYDTTLKDVLQVWTKQKAYSLNEVIQYKGKYLKCTTAGTSGTTTLNFTGVEVGDTITDGTVTWEVIEPPSGSGNGLNDWIANTQYKIDSIVVNDGQIYKSLVEFTSGSTFENIEILEDYVLQTGDTPIAWASGTEINTNDIVEYNSNYYKALYDFTCGSTFTKNVFEEYVPKSLTQAQIDDIVDNYNPVYSAATGVEYSTEERKVGTWIDGKPLYQKTYIGTTPSVDSISVISLASNVYTHRVEGYIIDSNRSFIPVPSFWGDNGFVGLYINNINNKINIKLGSGVNAWANSQCYITIQYTKTTD